MDNNFNMQQNNMNSPMQQPTYQQPMNQQPMYQQPIYQTMPVQQKKNTGLIIGIISGVVALIAIIAVVLVLVLSGGDDLVGTWTYTEDGETANFVFNDDNSGTMGASGISFPMTWERDGDTLKITMSLLGQSSTESFTIKELTDEKLVLSNGEEEISLTKAD